MPPACGSRPSLRTKAQEVRILSGVPLRTLDVGDPHKVGREGSIPFAATKRAPGRMGRRSLDTGETSRFDSCGAHGEDADVGFPQRFAKPPGYGPGRSTRSLSSTADSTSGKSRSCNLRTRGSNPRSASNATKVLSGTRGLAKAESPVRSRLVAPYLPGSSGVEQRRIRSVRLRSELRCAGRARVRFPSGEANASFV